MDQPQIIAETHKDKLFKEANEDKKEYENLNAEADIEETLKARPEFNLEEELKLIENDNTAPAPEDDAEAAALKLLAKEEDVPEPVNLDAEIPLKQRIAALPYYTPAEVAEHNTPESMWISFLGYVYDISEMFKAYPNDPRLRAFIVNAGHDVTHWFKTKGFVGPGRMDPLIETPKLEMCTNSRTGLRVPRCPDGNIPHVTPTTSVVAPSICDPPHGVEPWWAGRSELCKPIGKLTSRPCRVRIINTLTREQCIMEFCMEEPVKALLQRYTAVNSHAAGYTWKYNDSVIDMFATFKDNNIDDHAPEIEQLGLNLDAWLPSILLYYSDDLST